MDIQENRRCCLANLKQAISDLDTCLKYRFGPQPGNSRLSSHSRLKWNLQYQGGEGIWGSLCPLPLPASSSLLALDSKEDTGESGEGQVCFLCVGWEFSWPYISEAPCWQQIRMAFSLGACPWLFNWALWEFISTLWNSWKGKSPVDFSLWNGFPCSKLSMNEDVLCASILCVKYSIIRTWAKILIHAHCGC